MQRFTVRERATTPSEDLYLALRDTRASEDDIEDLPPVWVAVLGFTVTTVAACYALYVVLGAVVDRVSEIDWPNFVARVLS